MSQSDLQHFDRRIRAEREQLGVLAEEFAESARVHRKYFGVVERGEGIVDLFGVLRIARSLGVATAAPLEHFPGSCTR